MVSQILSLAAAGALLLSTASAETFDVRAQLLHNKFGTLPSRIARRQDDTSSSTEDLSTIIPSAASITSMASETGSQTTAFLTSRTASASSSATATRSNIDPYWSGPDALYIVDMCMPNFIDIDRAERLGLELTAKTEEGAYLAGAKLAISLGGSPFPCEQVIYIEYACHANATKPADFLAEQQCYCGSSIWEADQACNSCFLAHGLIAPSKEENGDRMAKFSEAVCGPTPVAGGLFAAAETMLPEATDKLEWASKSVVEHPSSTAVSLYYTSLPAISVPALTGEATARATNWGNWPGIKGSEATNGGASGAASGAASVVVPMMGAVLGGMMLGAGLVL